MTRSRLAPLAAALLAAAGCGSLSIPEEKQLGDRVAWEVSHQMPILRDRTVTRYVADLGADVLRAAGPQPFSYRFYVVADPDANAFAAPAGHVYVNTGTILRARNASELVGVIAHEIGHVAERHIAKTYKTKRRTDLGLDALAAGVGLLAGSTAAYATQLGSGLAATSVLNKFDRDAEREADEFAVRTMVGAGWDPDGLVMFFETLRAESPAGQTPLFLSSHPTTDERIEATRASIAKTAAGRSLHREDGGRLEIIQRRILLLTGSGH